MSLFCLRSFFAACLLGVLLSGCSSNGVEVVSEKDEKQYQLAKDRLREGRREEALNAFLRVTEVRRDAPESHLEAGYIFLRDLKDPIRAIYHFERYLQLKPQSPQITQVRQLIETAQKEFARQLPAQPYQGELDRIDLMELVKSLKVENESLKRDLIAAESRVQNLERMMGEVRSHASPPPEPERVRTARSDAPAQSPAREAAPSPRSAPRVYTVRSGDSLSSISREVYGTPSRWIDIYQANRDRLSSENALKVGQEIRIP